MVARTCSFRKENGEACRAPALRDADYCFWHSPDHAEEVAEARRLGGLRRRRERTVAGAYDIDGVETVEQIRRILQIALLDTLGLENSVARSRTLAYLAVVLLKMNEAGTMEERLLALEETLQPRLQQGGKRKCPG